MTTSSFARALAVLVKSPSADGQPGFSGTDCGYIKSGWYGGSSLNSAEEAGTAIGTAIATGKAEQEIHA